MPYMVVSQRSCLTTLARPIGDVLAFTQDATATAIHGHLTPDTTDEGRKKDTMQGGMILNQLTNHVREIMLALRKEYIRVPDTLCQILDSYARYRAGEVMGHSVSIPALLNRAQAFYYSGLDEAQEVTDDTQVERHFAYWKHMYADVLVGGTELKQTVGVTTEQLLSEGTSLGHMNDTDRLMLLNLLKSKYLTTAAGLQEKKVTGTHGHYQRLRDDETARKPESLDDLFNEDGDFHGISVDALGEWDAGHTWGRRPISNVGTEAEQKLRHRPQVYDFEQAGRYSESTPTKVRPTLKVLEPILRNYGNVVQGGKLGYMWPDGFSMLVQDVLSRNLNVPILIIGGAGWEFDMDCVKIAGTTLISDTNAKAGELRVMHVGTPGMEDGTVFPMYYDALTSPLDWLAMEAEMLSQNRGRPKGMDFGRPRMTPFSGQEWSRSERHVDAIYSRMKLDYIPTVSTVRGNQLKLKGFVEDFQAA